MILVFCSWFFIHIALNADCLDCHNYKELEEYEIISDRCISCFDITVCFRCLTIRYGNNCTICDKICGKCIPRKKDIASGICDNVCLDGYFGDRCDNACRHCKQDNQGVSKCNIFSGFCANGCVDGYYSLRCDRVCVHCKPDNQGLVKCSQKSGFCENGCVSGWYGDACNKTCSGTCFLSSCHQKSGFCEKGCVSGWHADTCGESCSSTCFNNSCDQYSGHCDNGCASAYYGDTCEFNCADTCKEHVCDRETSQCLWGCLAGYKGAFCNMTIDIGPDSVLVGFTSSLVGVTILLLFTLIIWFIRRKVLRGKRYGNLQMSTRDTSEPIYDEILDTDDTVEERRVSGNHLYMEVGSAQISRSKHESGSTTHNSCNKEIAGNCATTLAVVENISNTPLVCASALNRSALHSEVNTCNNSESGEVHTSSFISLDNAEVRRKSSNRSRKYYEIPDIIPNYEHNIETERNGSNDGCETPISCGRTTSQNTEAEEANLSVQCNRMTDFAISPTRDSKRTRNKDLMSTKHKEINVNGINQTLQKAIEGKCNSSSSEFDTDIPFKTHLKQEKVTEGDSDSLNYIHPVN